MGRITSASVVKDANTTHVIGFDGNVVAINSPILNDFTESSLSVPAANALHLRQSAASQIEIRTQGVSSPSNSWMNRIKPSM